jgi:8-oxo-dGTP pyrophosphatase MutT (NUDIX family)
MANAKPTAPPQTFTAHSSLSAYAVPSTTYLSQNSTLTIRDKPYTIAGLAGATVVIYPPASQLHLSQSRFHTQTQPTPHTLLIRRAAHDSAPNKWEVPGGAIDAEDESILAGCARELFEEAGLVATRLGPLLGEEGEPEVFLTRSGRIVLRVPFLAEVDCAAVGEGRAGGQEPSDAVEDWGLMRLIEKVKLDPNEHSAFVWATEEDVRLERMPHEPRLRAFGEGVEVPSKLEFTSREVKECILTGFEAWRKIRDEEGKRFGAAL